MCCKFSGFKQNPVNLQEIFGIHARIRQEGAIIHGMGGGGGWVFKNVTPGRRNYISAFYRPQRRKVMFSVHGVGGGGVSVPACITGHTGLCRGGLCPWVVSVWGGSLSGNPPERDPPVR